VERQVAPGGRLRRHLADDADPAFEVATVKPGRPNIATAHRAQAFDKKDQAILQLFAEQASAAY
jgi:hypothetical protein